MTKSYNTQIEPYLKDRLTFQEVVKIEGSEAGFYYRRCNYPARWCFNFDPDKAGKLTIHADGNERTDLPVEMYHHDLMDGVFVVSHRRSTKA